MGDLPRLSQREIDQLVAGNPPVGREVEDLAGLVREVRGAYLAPPAEAIEAGQLAAMAEAVRVGDSQDSPVRPRSEKAPRRPRALAWKEATMTRIRTAALAAKLAAATLIAALATGGLAAAGVITLPVPDPFPGGGQSTAVHEAIQGSDTDERCGFGFDVAAAASGERPDATCEQENGNTEAQARRGKGASARGNGDVGTQSHGGAHPDPQRLQQFGDDVSDEATGGEPQQNGREFGESVRDRAQNLVEERPTPQTTPQGGRETGESFSEQGQESGESFSQQGQQTGENASGRAPGG